MVDEIHLEFLNSERCKSVFARMTLAISVFSWFSDWIPKMQKCVNCCRSRQELSRKYLLAKFIEKSTQFRYSRERASQSLPKISKKLEIQLEQT